MSGKALLQELATLGAEVWLEGKEVRCRGSKKAITPTVVAQLKKHKPEIVEQLSRPSTLTTLIEGTDSDTTVRTTNLTNLIEEPRQKVCIHRLRPEDCHVCNGYARWLAEDEERLQRAIANPEKAREEYRWIDWEEI